MSSNEQHHQMPLYVRRSCGHCAGKNNKTVRASTMMYHLNDGHFGFESLRQLRQHFTKQLLMFQALPHLHNPNNRRLHITDTKSALV